MFQQNLEAIAIAELVSGRPLVNLRRFLHAYYRMPSRG